MEAVLDADSISVAIRIRPLSDIEIAAGHVAVFQRLPNCNQIGQLKDGQFLAGQTFEFDKVYDENATTSQIYVSSARALVADVVSGINGTIFAYGQTNSGKTHTMLGDEENRGILEMALDDIFDLIGSPRKEPSPREECSSEHSRADEEYDVKNKNMYRHENENENNTYFHSNGKSKFNLRMSFIEVYNEEIFDLLSLTKNMVSLREDKKTFCCDATEIQIEDYQSVLAELERGISNRSVEGTAMNRTSSGSHTILRLTIESQDTINEKDDEDENDRQTDTNSEKENAIKRNGRDREIEKEEGVSRRISTLTLVDLAGSENVKTATLPTSATSSSTSISTLASNSVANAAITQRMLEGEDINESLHALNNVFLSITDPEGVFVNFRGSKLTQLLQNSLNGNSNISIVCCITPSKMYLDETRSSLSFAKRAKRMKIFPRKNEVFDDAYLARKYKKEVDVLQIENLRLKALMNALTSPDGKVQTGYIGENDDHDDEVMDILVSDGKRGRERGSRKESISGSNNRNTFSNSDCDGDGTCGRTYTYTAPTPSQRSSMPYTPSTGSTTMACDTPLSCPPCYLSPSFSTSSSSSFGITTAPHTFSHTYVHTSTHVNTNTHRDADRYEVRERERGSSLDTHTTLSRNLPTSSISLQYSSNKTSIDLQNSNNSNNNNNNDRSGMNNDLNDQGSNLNSSENKENSENIENLSHTKNKNSDDKKNKCSPSKIVRHNHSTPTLRIVTEPSELAALSGHARVDLDVSTHMEDIYGCSDELSTINPYFTTNCNETDDVSTSLARMNSSPVLTNRVRAFSLSQSCSPTNGKKDFIPYAYNIETDYKGAEFTETKSERKCREKEGERMNDLATIEELTLQLRRANHKLDEIKKNRNSRYSVKNELVADSPIHHFYGSRGFTDSAGFSSMMEEELEIEQSKIGRGEWSGERGSERGSVGDEEIDVDESAFDFGFDAIYNDGVETDTSLSPKMEPTPNADDINNDYKANNDNNNNNENDDGSDDSQCSTELDASYFRRFICSPSPRPTLNKNTLENKNEIENLRFQIKNLTGVVKSYKKIFRNKNLREANEVINAQEMKLESQDYLIKNFREIINFLSISDKIKISSDDEKKNENEVVKKEVQKSLTFAEFASGDYLLEEKSFDSDESDFNESCDESVKYSKTKMDRNSLKDDSVDYEEINKTEVTVKSQKLNICVAQNENFTDINSNNFVLRDKLARSEEIRNQQKNEISTLKKLIASFRNLIGELSTCVNTEIKEANALIPVLKNKIFELEDKCFRLEEMLVYHRKNVEEELNGANMLLIDANSIITMQKKNILEFASILSLLASDNAQYTIKKKIEEVVEEVVPEIVPGINDEECVYENENENNGGNDRVGEDMKDGEISEISEIGEKCTDVRVTNQARGGMGFFKGVKRSSAGSGRGSFLLSRTVKKIQTTITLQHKEIL